MTFLLLPFVHLRTKKAEQHARSSSPPLCTGNGKRIPDTLKAVFLASNAGKDVSVINPPPARVASKTFFHSVLHSFKSTSNHLSSSARQRAAKERHNQWISSLPSCADTECGTENPDPDADPGYSVFEALIPTMAPQDYLDTMIKARGHSTTCYETLKTAYHNAPTALQLASYDGRLIDLVRKRDLPALQSLVQCGISLNPCNAHGESLLHTICRLGDAEILKLWVEAGATVQVADDYGRTPLHDACWTVQPNFDVMEILLRQDPHLLHMKDARGTTPLAYVRQENWGPWVEFFVAKRDVFWPPSWGEAEEVPPLTAQQPHSRPVPGPSGALTPRLAAMVASGKLSLTELELLRGDVLLDANGEVVFDASTSADSDYFFDDSDHDGDDSDNNDDDDDVEDSYSSEDDSECSSSDNDESLSEYASNLIPALNTGNTFADPRQRTMRASTPV